MFLKNMFGGFGGMAENILKINNLGLPSMSNVLNKDTLNTIISELGNNKFESVVEEGKLGSALSGKILDKNIVQKGFSNIFGTEIKETGKFVQISGTKTFTPQKLTAEQLKLLKDNGISDDVLKELTSTGKAKLEYSSMDDLATKIGGKDAVKNLAKASGTKIEEGISKEIIVGKSALAESTAQKALTLGNSVAKKLGKTALNEETVVKLSEKAGVSVGKLGGLTAKSCKKIPVAGALLAAAFEIPSIISATKEEGIGGGLKQVGRSTCSVGGGLAAAEVGAIIGTAICPGVGTLIGGIIGYAAGEFIGSKAGNLIFGKRKSATETAQSEITSNILDDNLANYISSPSYENPYNGANMYGSVA